MYFDIYFLDMLYLFNCIVLYYFLIFHFSSLLFSSLPLLFSSLLFSSLSSLLFSSLLFSSLLFSFFSSLLYEKAEMLHFLICIMPYCSDIAFNSSVCGCSCRLPPGILEHGVAAPDARSWDLHPLSSDHPDTV